LLEESFVRPRPGAPSGPGLASSLALDVQETPEQFTVTASVPGVPSSAIDIAVLGDTLRIRGHRQEATEESGEGGRWLLRERRFGPFERTVTLPTTVDAERASAAFHDGVLTITLPKAEIATPKTIPVSGSTVSAASAPARLTFPGGETQPEGTTKTSPRPATPEATQAGVSEAASGQRLSERDTTQAPPNAVRGDGTTTCPADYPVKGNADSGIYHTPDSPSYGQTIAEFCFASTSAAEAAGFQAAGA
jgi:HSP20 family protein